MSTGTGIEWTDATWNPVVGCTPVSPECLNCYAATFAARNLHSTYVGLTVRRKGEGGRTRAVFNGTVRCLPDKLSIPLHWRKPRRVFVNSTSDLFHESVPFEFIDRVFAVMALCPQHTFQVLTKRPERMAEYLLTGGKIGNRYNERETHVGLASIAAVCANWKSGLGRGVMLQRDGELVNWPLPNVWLGTSAERQEELDARVPHLLRCPAAVRFLSLEPLLGEVDLWSPQHEKPNGGKSGAISKAWPPSVNWVIVGGESGAGARPCDVAWIRSIVKQCRAASVPVFVKQLGAWPYWDGCGLVAHNPPCRTHREVIDGREYSVLDVQDRKGGDPFEWPEDLRVREMPEVAHG